MIMICWPPVFHPSEGNNALMIGWVSVSGSILSRADERRPCLELLWTNMLVETASGSPFTSGVVDTEIYVKKNVKRVERLSPQTERSWAKSKNADQLISSSLFPFPCGHLMESIFTISTWNSWHKNLCQLFLRLFDTVQLIHVTYKYTHLNNLPKMRCLLFIIQKENCITWNRRTSRGFPADFKQFWLHFINILTKYLKSIEKNDYSFTFPLQI